MAIISRKIFAFLIYISLSIINFSKQSKRTYDINNILDNIPKSSINYNFEHNSSTFNPTNTSTISSLNTFNKYFFDFYTAPMPFYEGDMICYYPVKKKFNFDANITNFLIKNATKISNISEGLGKILLKNLNYYCSHHTSNKWFYKICPFQKAIQILTFLKIDPKTNKTVKEINTLGYAKNSSSLFDDVAVYEQFSGAKIDANNYHPDFNSKNYVTGKLLADNGEQLVKIFGHKKKDKIDDGKEMLNFMDDNDIKLYIDVEYDLDDIENFAENDNIFVDKFYNNYEQYKKNTENTSGVITYTREIIKKVNRNLYIINEKLPSSNNIRDFKIYASKFLEKDDNKKSQSFLYKKYFFCSFCNLLKCLENPCLVIDNFNQTKIINNIIDESLSTMEDVTERGSDNFSDRKLILYNSEGYLVSIFPYEYNRKTIIADENSSDEFFFVCESANFVSNFVFKDKDYLIPKKHTIKSNKKLGFFIIKSINDTTNFYRFKTVNIINETTIKLKLVNDMKINNKNFTENLDATRNILMLGKMDENLLNKINILHKKVNKKNRNKFKEFYIKKEGKFLTKFYDISALSQIKIPFTKSQMISYKTPNDHKFVIHFELKAITGIKEAFSHFYLSKQKKITPDDYEIFLNSKNGLLIKQIKDNDTFTFFSNNNVPFFAEKLFLEIICVNNTVYFNSFNNEYSSVKLKYNLKRNFSDINYFTIDFNLSNNVKIKEILFTDVINENLKMNIFFYEMLFLLNDNATYVEKFTGGDYCESLKKYRNVTIYYECDWKEANEIKINKVFEDKNKLCEYVYYVGTRYLCNPLTLMKKKIENSNLEVNCVPENLTDFVGTNYEQENFVS